MNEVLLRPIKEADLDDLCRYSTDPEAAGEFEWTGFTDPKAMRRRWEEDGWLGPDRGRLAVVSADSLAGHVSYRDRSPGALKCAIYEMGIALFPVHRGQGVGTIAQRLLVQYLFDITPAHRLEAYTEVENIAEQRALEKIGLPCESSSKLLLEEPPGLLGGTAAAAQQLDPRSRGGTARRCHQRRDASGVPPRVPSL